MPYSTKPDTKSETDTPVMKHTKDTYKKDVDLLTSFAQWSSSWRMAQFNSCSRVSKLLMCHNLLSGIYADFYTLEEGILVFARSLQLLIRDREHVTLVNGNIIEFMKITVYLHSFASTNYSSVSPLNFECYIIILLITMPTMYVI